MKKIIAIFLSVIMMLTTLISNVYASSNSNWDEENYNVSSSNSNMDEKDYIISFREQSGRDKLAKEKS